MSDLIKQIVTSVVDDVVKELLGKSHGRTPSKRKKRQTRAAASGSPRSATTGRFTGKKPRTRSELAKPAKKQTSRRRTATSRSKQRSR